ncbi:MAG TPA: protein kinase [Labilithrix sp.]|nr:protein kinase [Labilithrix sp.]
MPAPGEVILGRFRLESVLGEGGMGLVFAAKQLPSETPVAVKVLLPAASEHPEAVPRFLNEARATTQLLSPHVVRIFEAGSLDIGLPFIVMERLEGTDLAVVLEKRGKLPVAEAVDYIIQATDALVEAHALGIVHRDLKPSNLFLHRPPNATPIVKVLDFGISKIGASKQQNQALTATGTFLGSPHYMSPEQLRSAKNVDPRADTWSLGVILYELLAGNPPFDGGSFGDLFMKVLNGEYAPLSSLSPEVPQGLEQVISRCLRRSRDERFGNLVELAQALAPFASPDGARAAERVGRPRTTAPMAAVPSQVPAAAASAPPVDARKKLASTALLQDRPPLPAILSARSTGASPPTASSGHFAVSPAAPTAGNTPPTASPHQVGVAMRSGVLPSGPMSGAPNPRDPSSAYAASPPPSAVARPRPGTESSASPPYPHPPTTGPALPPSTTNVSQAAGHAPQPQASGMNVWGSAPESPPKKKTPVVVVAVVAFVVLVATAIGVALATRSQAQGTPAPVGSSTTTLRDSVT